MFYRAICCFISYPKIWGQVGTLSKFCKCFLSKTIGGGGGGNSKKTFKSMIYSKHWGQKYLTSQCKLHLWIFLTESSQSRGAGVATTLMGEIPQKALPSASNYVLMIGVFQPSNVFWESLKRGSKHLSSSTKSGWGIPTTNFPIGIHLSGEKRGLWLFRVQRGLYHPVVTGIYRDYNKLLQYKNPY